MDLNPATGQNRAFFERFHLDLPLILGLLVLMGFGLVVMYKRKWSKYCYDGAPSNAYDAFTWRHDHFGADTTKKL